MKSLYNPIRVAALVDLARTPQSGGHVKCWERLGAASVSAGLPLDLTVYFSGRLPEERLGPHMRFRYLPPVFSTASLPFLPYVPDHTDLSFYHPRLARELGDYDIIHTTDGYFTFAQTAARVSQKCGIPLVSSLHTDTPSYTRIFTRQTIEKIFGGSGWGQRARRLMVEDWDLPGRQERIMEKKLCKHLRACRHALAGRKEDHVLAANVLGEQNVSRMRRGVDKQMFGPHRRDRAGIERDYRVAPDHTIILFVGRVDIGKNIHTLVAAVENLLARGYKLHLIVAGIGPMSDKVKARLGDRVTLPGFVAPEELGRLYASADVLAVASEVETHSMVATEAMTCGCPVLMSAKSGVADVFNAAPALQVVDGGVEAWIEALDDFARQPDRQAMMRSAARDYGQNRIVDWVQVLAQDFFPIWQKFSTSRQTAIDQPAFCEAAE